MKTKFLFSSFILLIAFVQSGCAVYRQPAPAPRLPAVISPALPLPIGLYHRVEFGQTLWAISRNYGIGVNSLMKYNNIHKVTKLPAGGRIFIPAKSGLLPVVPLRTTRSKKWQYIIIHHSATDIGAAKSFDKGHKRRGFKHGLGYHFVIDNGTQGTKDGDIEVGQRWFYQTIGAHCQAGGMNKKSIGICLVGNFDKEKPSQKQIGSLIALIEDLRRHYKIPLNNIKGHKDVSGAATNCPGKYFPWRRVKQELSRRNLPY